MRNTLASLLIFSITSVQVFAGVGTSSMSPPGTALQEDQWQISFTPEQLENLLAPIALYPDPLLAQVLLAATFPDQIDEAARTMRAYNNRYDVDATDWDVSVKAVAHYPTVLSMMADKIDWTTSVGQAYVNQSADVMDAIQRLRRQARSLDNLVTTAQQEVVETEGYIYIYPAQPQYIYLPTYDPEIVYFSRPGFYWGPVIVFSIGFVIGAWLNHDCDWHHHRVFYHGWGHGPVWVGRSRPYIHVNNVYVNRRYENVVVNRGVMDHRVNYGALNRYRAIHRDTDYNNVRRERGTVGERRVPPGPTQPRPDNKIIRRNIDPYDPRIDANRGRSVPQPQPDARREQPRPDTRREQPRPEIRPSQPPTSPGTVPGRQPEERGRRPDVGRTQPISPQPQPEARREQPRPEIRTPQFPLPQAGSERPRVEPGTRPEGGRTHPISPQPRGQVQAPRQPDSVFRGNAGGIDSRDASRRGQTSREHEYRPVPSAPTGAQPRQPSGQPHQQGPPPGHPPGQPGKPHGRSR